MFKFSPYMMARIGLLACLSFFLLGCGNTPIQSQQKGNENGKGGGGKGGQGRGQQSVPVGVAKVESRDMPVLLSGLGSVDAFNTVVVKTRIDGQLDRIAIKEGQEVHKGELLAVIDPRPYEVALSQAQANLFKDQSSLKDAQLNLLRFQELYKAGVIPQQQFDTQGSLVGQLQGTILADQAQIDSVKLNLVYTRITAPVGGRVGLRQVDVGNMVHAADPNGLLVITQLQPIAVLFTLPEDNLPTVSKQMHKGKLQAEAYSRDDQTKLATGTLLTIDNQIDITTGTGKLKAVFDNHDRSLWPNQFVNIHLLLEVRKNNTVVPVAAIQRGPQGTYVFTVKPEKTASSAKPSYVAEMRPVTLAFTEGNFSSITEGLSPGETVVIDGQDKLQPGSHVEMRSGGPGQKSGQSSESGQ
jgi:multidrug efflux system membrane fusion protein